MTYLLIINDTLNKRVIRHREPLVAKRRTPTRQQQRFSNRKMFFDRVMIANRLRLWPLGQRRLAGIRVAGRLDPDWLWQGTFPRRVMLRWRDVRCVRLVRRRLWHRPPLCRVMLRRGAMQRVTLVWPGRFRHWPLPRRVMNFEVTVRRSRLWVVSRESLAWFVCLLTLYLSRVCSCCLRLPCLRLGCLLHAWHVPPRETRVSSHTTTTTARVRAVFISRSRPHGRHDNAGNLATAQARCTEDQRQLATDYHRRLGSVKSDSLALPVCRGLLSCC